MNDMKKYIKILEDTSPVPQDHNNMGYDNILKTGFYGQNQDNIDDRKVFDIRKNIEFINNVPLSDKNSMDVVILSPIEKKDDIYEKIIDWVYKKTFNNLNYSNLSEYFEKIFWFLLNNSQEIYEVFGKSLNDEERKIVLVNVLKKYDEALKNNLISDLIDNNDTNLLEFTLKTGIPLEETFTKILERAPKNPKAEEFIKKSKKDFKKRYGDRWKEVLYATAWKKFGESKEAENIKKDDVKENKNSKYYFKKHKDSKYLKIRKMKRLLKSFLKKK